MKLLLLADNSCSVRLSFPFTLLLPLNLFLFLSFALPFDLRSLPLDFGLALPKLDLSLLFDLLKLKLPLFLHFLLSFALFKDLEVFFTIKLSLTLKLFLAFKTALSLKLKLLLKILLMFELSLPL